MNQLQTNVATDFFEDYTPKGHLYAQDDGVLDFLAQSDSRFPKRSFISDVATGYAESFKEMYSLIKNAPSQIKNYFNQKNVEEKSIHRNNGSIDDLLRADGLSSDRASFLLIDVLQKEVLERVNKYFSENSYDDIIVTKVKMAYEFAVKNSTLALSKEEVRTVLKNIANQDSHLEDSSVLRNYANNFVDDTFTDTLMKNKEIQGKYSVPRMNLISCADPVSVNYFS